MQWGISNVGKALPRVVNARSRRKTTKRDHHELSCWPFLSRLSFPLVFVALHFHRTYIIPHTIRCSDGYGGLIIRVVRATYIWSQCDSPRLVTTRPSSLVDWTHSDAASVETFQTAAVGNDAPSASETACATASTYVLWGKNKAHQGASKTTSLHLPQSKTSSRAPNDTRHHLKTTNKDKIKKKGRKKKQTSGVHSKMRENNTRASDSSRKKVTSSSNSIDSALMKN